jgi:hypothetical protein
MRAFFLMSLFAVVTMASAIAQAPALQTNVVYVCNDGQSFKVFSCNDTTGACDYQNYKHGQAYQRGEALRVQLAALLPAKCHAQTPAEAQADPHRGEIPPAPSPFKAHAGVGSGSGSGAAANSQSGSSNAGVSQSGASQPGGGGFKVGETVRVLSSGWQEAKVLQVRGNSYYVRLDNGIEVSKSWPVEVRRLGKLTAEDHTVGQWDLRDKVQVLVNGRWMEGKIVGQSLNRYTVGFADENTVETSPENLRISTAAPPSVRQAGLAPKPGLASCAGKYEGRWEHASGMGGMTVVFRSGKATVSEGLGGPMEFECWISGSQIVLYKAGSFTPFSYGFDVNNDGTLQTPLGAIKKMGN